MNIEILWLNAKQYARSCPLSINMSILANILQLTTTYSNLILIKQTRVIMFYAALQIKVMDKCICNMLTKSYCSRNKVIKHQDFIGITVAFINIQSINKQHN